MAWAVRGDKRYYYRSRTVGGEQIREYVGSGPEAEKAAAEVEKRHQDRLAQRRQLRDEEEQHEAALAPLLELDVLIDALTRASLVGHGFHQHARSEWRRRR